jgi:glutathione S-transferase
MSSPPPAITLGYWKIRGLAQPIRTLLRFLGVPFTDRLFEQGDAPSFSREAWLSHKGGLGLEFPNLPYLIDATDASAPVRLTQSAAILRYLARQYGASAELYGGSPARLAAVDQALDQAIDLRNQYTRTAYGGAPFEAFADTVLPGFLSLFDAAVARGGWLAPGAAPTIADFVLGEVLDAVAAMVAELAGPSGRERDAFKAFPAVAAYKTRYDELTAAARASPDNMARPFNNKVAVWK